MAPRTIKGTINSDTPLHIFFPFTADGRGVTLTFIEFAKCIFFSFSFFIFGLRSSVEAESVKKRFQAFLTSPRHIHTRHNPLTHPHSPLHTPLLHSFPVRHSRTLSQFPQKRVPRHITHPYPFDSLTFPSAHPSHPDKHTHTLPSSPFL